MFGRKINPFLAVLIVGACVIGLLFLCGQLSPNLTKAGETLRDIELAPLCTAAEGGVQELPVQVVAKKQIGDDYYAVVLVNNVPCVTYENYKKGGIDCDFEYGPYSDILEGFR